MDALLVAVIGITNVVCFVLGAKVVQKVAKGETIEMPTLNPIEAVKERNNKKQAEWEQGKIDTIMRNIESYDGTGNGQEDVPRG